MDRSKKMLVCASFLSGSLLFAQPAFAGTSAEPDPATAGTSVAIAPDDEACAKTWNQLVDASANNPIYGALVITWPDGTETIINPLTNPVNVTVPAGMDPGTATLNVYKGLVDGSPEGLYEACAGSFEIAEDANIPLLDPATLLAIAGVGSGAAAIRHKRSKRDS